jgi:hypothetical protein
MSCCSRDRVAGLVLAATTLLIALPTAAQTSIGYADPDDLDALLDYRLPDWGWRTWTGRFDFAGGGNDDGEYSSNHHAIDLATAAAWNRESEQRIWRVSVASELNLETSNTASEVDERDDDRLAASSRVSASGRRYLGTSPLFVTGSGFADWSYIDRSHERSDRGTQESLERNYLLDGQLGFGIGRERNVTPVIWATRISERLGALGRGRLTRDEVLAVAEAIAQRSGYTNVYERDQRHFWQAVLEPALDGRGPLTPYEIEYLEEALIEDTGDRTEGAMVSVTAGWRGYDRFASSSSPDRYVENRSRPHQWSGRVRAGWSHNASLVTMWRLRAYADYMRWNQATGDEDNGRLGVSATWLRNVADRQRLEVELAANGYYSHLGVDRQDGSIRRELRTSLRVTDRIWIEDTLSLEPYASVAYLTESRTAGDAREPRVSWSYGASLTYNFDSALY